MLLLRVTFRSCFEGGLLANCATCAICVRSLVDSCVLGSFCVYVFFSLSDERSRLLLRWPRSVDADDFRTVGLGSLFSLWPDGLGPPE